MINEVKMTNDTKKYLIEVNSTFYSALANCSIMGMDQVWLQEDDSVCIHPGWPPLIGWNSIRDSWERIFKNNQMHQIDIEIVKCSIDDRLGYIICFEKLGTIHENKIDKSVTIATNIYVKSNNLWKLSVHQVNSIPYL